MEERNLTNLRLLPVFTFFWLVSTFIISYAIAVSLDHVYPLWPYISDTGTIPPDSCVFGLMLNIGSFLMAIVIFIRYQQIKLILLTYEGHHRLMKMMNVFCLIVGIVAAFGVCIVANFQETSNMAMHLLGANLAFGVGSFYFIVHTIIGFFIHKEKLILNLLRTLLCVFYICSFATTLIFARLAFDQFDGDVKAALQWKPHFPGYDYRLGSTFSEWVLAVCQGLYVLSFYFDFKTIGYRLNYSLMNTEKKYSNGISEMTVMA